MSNIIDITERVREQSLKEHTLNFRCPGVFYLNTENSKNIIKLEISNGEGTAVVKAKNSTEAKQELHKVIAVTEWIT